jgi:hypothetical protein
MKIPEWRLDRAGTVIGRSTRVIRPP